MNSTHTTTAAPAEIGASKRRKPKAKRRLKNVVVEEVSLVDRGAVVSSDWCWVQKRDEPRDLKTAMKRLASEVKGLAVHLMSVDLRMEVHAIDERLSRLEHAASAMEGQSRG
jgi:hypothetical protein